MRIAIVAAGGVGGYFGGRLAASGHDVSFIARGPHLDRIRQDGLRIESPLGDLHLRQVAATDDATDIGPVDVVLFAVKLWDTEGAAEACHPLIGAETVVITLQNGVSSMDMLSVRLGAGHVAGGVAHIAASIAEPGLIRHGGTLARLIVGERDGERSSRLSRFAVACGEARIDCTLTANIEGAIWEKFIFLSAFSGLTSLCRQAIGPIMEDKDAQALFEGAIHEATAVARARGIGLSPETENEILVFANGLPPDMTSSMLRDLQAGRRLELPWLSGEVVRLGREYVIPTPVHSAVYGGLKLHAG